MADRSRGQPLAGVRRALEPQPRASRLPSTNRSFALDGPRSGDRDWRRLRVDLLEWSREQGRILPGRDTRDPWRVLVLEVMSQQTQIDRALTAAARFCARFPTPAALAAATPADAIRAWSGLGYNRRAVALWRSAGEIAARHDGAVPSDVDALDELPGVGPYTARAVAVHAFGVRVAPVDVNVARVVGRLIGSTATARIQAAADSLLDPAEPSRTVHALMDLAATVCARRNPACATCPLASSCASVFVARDVATRSPRAAAFPSTRRWLRGALLRELVGAPGSSWRDFEGRTLGSHPPHAVREALAGLAADGLIELEEPARARLVEERSVSWSAAARTSEAGRHRQG